MNLTEKYAALKAATGSHWSTHKTSYKETGIAAAVGVGSYFAANWIGQHFQQLRQYWWGMPAIMAVGGHFLKSKNAAAGHALIGAAGFLGAMSYQMSHPTQTAQPAQPAREVQGYGYGDLSQGVFDQVERLDAGAMQDARGLQVSGFDDAGALQEVDGFEDAGDLDEAGDISDD